MRESGEDIRKRYRKKLGAEFGSAFYGLWNEWAWSRMRCDEFQDLFTRAEDVSLLNAVAGGGFTWDMQNVLWDDLLLRVCRLTDRAETAGKQNLTVRRLPALCEKKCWGALHEQVQNLVDAAVEKTQFARDWRNRRISHSDLATVVGEAEPLPPASLRNVTSAVDAVHAVLNAISKELMKAEIGNSISGGPRARAFLAYARQLAESVKFADAVVDPGGAAPIADTDIAVAFLKRVGLKPTMDNIRHVIELRQAAGRIG